MNEQIKALVAKAGIKGSNINNPDYVYEISQSELEKFAELIINECCEALYAEGRTYVVPSAGASQSEWFAEAVRKHFQ